MDLQLLEWSYQGIRGVGDLTINLERQPGRAFHSSLLMMPNGTGKTTTITLLRAIFDGTAEKWNPTTVKNFRPSNSVTEGLFKAKMTIDDSVFIVELRLDYQNGHSNYNTTRVGRIGGADYGHKLPAFVKDIFTEEFVKRFVFDGEWAQRILSSGKDEAERSIKYLYQLNKLEELVVKINRLVEDAQKRNEQTSATNPQAITRFRNEYHTAEANLNRIKNDIFQKTKELEGIENRLIGLRERIDGQISSNQELAEEAGRASDEKNYLYSLIKQKNSAVLNKMFNPYFLSPIFANRLNDLVTNMQQLKLPKTMSRQFFEELAEQNKCICGRAIHEEHKDNILQNTREYLGEDQIGVLNAIKSAIRDRSYNPLLVEEIAELNKLIRSYNLAIQKWERIQLRQKELGGDLIQQMYEDIVDLERRRDQLQRELERLMLRDEKEIKEQNIPFYQNLYSCEEKLNKARLKLAEVTRTVQFQNSADVTKSYLEQIEKNALQKLKEKIRQKTNKMLSEIIKTETIYVQSIEQHLVLRDKNGTSVGQALAIAYSYLGALFRDSSHKLPFIVDSPAGALDLGVRREVSQILPNLFDQLIVFITSGEREGFCEHFYSMEDVQFTTINKLAGKVSCQEGIDFFRSFQDLVGERS